MLHTQISEEPTRQDNETLQHYIFMHVPSAKTNMEHRTIKKGSGIGQNNKWQEDQGAEHGVEK